MTSSSELFIRAMQRIPGGVNSPVRAFRSVGLAPPYIASGRGSRLFDTDGRSYIDYVCSWGALIAGHAHPLIIDAVIKSAGLGTSFGACCELEVRMAETLGWMVPSLEKVRMVSSGTEAAMSAVRLARAYAARDKIIKFAGCYHGHADGFLSRSGSGLMTHGIPGSPGVTAGTAADTLIATYNDLRSVERLLSENPGQVAAVIVEPVAANMGVVLPAEDFLPGLRRLCSSFGALLIFDEVITGFRLGRGGAQGLFGITPDLTILGKIIGGGLPAAAFGGKKEIMDLLAPVGPVYQAGTLSGNPVALSAGLASLEIVRAEGFFTRLNGMADSFFQELGNIFKKSGIPFIMNSVASLGSVFFSSTSVFNDESASRSDTSMYARYFGSMLKRGIYLAPSQFEAMFISSAHSSSDLDQTLEAVARVLKEMHELR